MTEKDRIKILIKIFVFLTLNSAFLSASSAYGKVIPLEKQLEQVIKSNKINKSDLGLMITYTSNGHEKDIYKLNSERKFIPASLTKIMTAGAALNKFSINHRFITQLAADGALVKGQLNGPLYLIGGGDPGFVSESLWQLVNKFVRSGIKSINGDVIVDDSRFDDVRYDPGRDFVRNDRAYDSPIGAMTFNWSSVNIYVRPGEKVGEPLKIFADPESSYIQVLNKSKTLKRGKGKKVFVKRLKKDKSGADELKDTIVVTGGLGIDQGEATIYKSITRAAYWPGIQLVEFLRRRGIKVTGTVKRGRANKKVKVLAEFESKPLSNMVKGMMKFSNNYIAEILTKNMAAEFKSKPATMEDGLRVIEDYLRDIGLLKNNYKIVSPSGLSKNNRIRPQDLHKVLISTKRSFRVYPEFLSALPISGVDGTLKSRLKNSNGEGQVRAKTGMLNGVVGLAGYVGRKNGEVVTFVFIFNGKNKRTWDAKKLFDEMLIKLIEV